MTGSESPSVLDADLVESVPASPARTSHRNDVSFHWLMLLISAGVLLAAVLLRIDNQTKVELPGLNFALPDLCYFRRMTGLGCPGCGMTRSFISLAHGDFTTAWQFNPAGPLLFFLLVGQLPYRSWQLYRLRTGRDEWSAGPWDFLPLYLWVVVLLGQWFVRLLLG